MNFQIPDVIPGDWTRMAHIVRQIRRSLGTQAALSFGTLTINSQTIADDARGLSVVTKLVTNAKSDGIAGYFEGHIDGITDGPTYAVGAWLNIDSGSTTYDVRALDIGIYESGADCTGGNAYGLAIHMEFDNANSPAAIYPFRLNTNVTGATPDALIFAANKAAVPITESGFPGLANAYTKIVVQDGTVYRIPVVDENNIGGDFGATNLITTGTIDTGVATIDGAILGNNQYVQFGVADSGLGGALGCDGRIYSDGTNLIIQVESPSGGLTNPYLVFGYHDYFGGGLYIPRISSPGSSDIFVLDRVLYVKDSSGDFDAQIFVADKANDAVGLVLTFNSDNDYGNISAGGDLRLVPAGNLLINPSGTGVRIGSVVAPTVALDVTGDIKATGFLQLTQKAGTATDGDLWNDSTQEALQTFVSGIEQTLVGVIFTQTADQTIANTTTETTLFGTGVGTLTLPANFWTVGKTIRVEIHGDFADFGNPTVEIQAYYGATSLIDSTPIALSGLGGTEEWETEVVITCRSIGVSGTVETVIDWEYETTTGSSPIERLDVAGVLRTINTTVSGVLDVTFQWGTAAAANTLHSHVGFVEILN